MFSWSYQHLDADAARLFRLVSLHPRLDFGVQAAAALAAITSVHARRLLDGLARAHLVLWGSIIRSRRASVAGWDHP